MSEIYEFPIFKNLSQRDRYIQEIVWMCQKYLWTDMPEVVWHYTSVDSLSAILKSKSLLFTHVAHQDDPNEVTSSAVLIEAVLKSYLQATDLTNRTRTLYETALSQISKNPDDSQWYSFSTSAAEDDAGQWFRYGALDKGVSIGFDPKALLSFLKSPPYDSPLCVPIEYDSSKTLKFFSLLACLGVQNFHKDFQDIQNDQLAVEKFLSEWGQHINHLSISTKLPGWNAQKEWRFAKSLDWNQAFKDDLFLLDNKKRWRVTRGANSEIGSIELPISRIILGPKCDSSEVEIGEILIENGLQKIQITRSMLRKYSA